MNKTRRLLSVNGTVDFTPTIKWVGTELTIALLIKLPNRLAGFKRT